MRVAFETSGAMRIVETKGGEPGMTAGALVLSEDMTLDELEEFEERVEDAFTELMDRRASELMKQADDDLLAAPPHGPRGCVHRIGRRRGLGCMADTVFDREQWRNDALDRTLLKGRETDDR